MLHSDKKSVLELIQDLDNNIQFKKDNDPESYEKLMK